MSDFVINKFVKNKEFNKKYIKTYTFKGEDAKSIINVLKETDVGNELLFDDMGNILIRNIQNKEMKYTFKNPLSKNEPRTDTGAIITPNEFSDQDTFYSKENGLWILKLLGTDKVELYYNPASRVEFVDFYKSNEDSAFNQIIDMCYQFKGQDPICHCVNKPETASRDTEFCMNDMFGGDATLRKKVKAISANQGQYGYDYLAKYCGCVNQRCKDTNKFNQIYRKKGTANECPDKITITMCNVNFSADTGGNINTGKNSISQKCGESLNPPDDNKPDDNKPDDNKPDDNKPDDNKPDDNKPDDKKPDDKKPDDKKPDDKKPDNKKPDDKKPDNKKPDDKKPSQTIIYIFVSIVILLLLAIGFFYFKKRKQITQ